jgi:hypothetical protein
MRVLLVKPAPAAIEFGLAPFFQTEPLGLQYVASALAEHGHTSTIVDLRFDRRFRGFWNTPGRAGGHLGRHPRADAVRELASVKSVDRATTVVTGGHDRDVPAAWRVSGRRRIAQARRAGDPSW